MDPYRTQEIDRRELVVPVAGGRDTQTLMLALALLGGIIVLRAVILSAVGHLLLAAVAALVVLGFYRSRTTRAFLLSRERIALVESTFRRRTLATINMPEHVAIATSATGTILNGEPELCLDLVADRGRITLRLFGKSAASELERSLATALAELELQATSQCLQGSIREQVLADGRVALSWRRALVGPPRVLSIAAVGCVAGMSVAMVSHSPHVGLGVLLAMSTLLAFAMPRTARRTIAISSDGFEIELVPALRSGRSAGRGRLRVRLFSVERDRSTGVFAMQRNHLPADVDSRVWQLAIESADGVRAIISGELTPYELNWLAQRIESVQESLAKARA